MEHKERIEIAHKLGNLLIKKYGKNIIAIGVFGSTARAEDRKFSDLELLCVTKKPVENKAGLYKDIHLLIMFNTNKEYKKIATTIDVDWPRKASTFLNVLSIYDPTNFFQKVKNQISKVKYSKYVEAAAYCLSLCNQYFLKIKNAIQSKDKIELKEASIKFSLNAALFYALINKSYYKNSTRILDFEKFKNIPKNYKRSMFVLRGYSNSSNKRIFLESSRLLNEMTITLKKLGMKIYSYNDLRRVLV